jgi:hypothetical protein
MKLSISIAAEDVDFIDSYAEAHGIDTRSGVVQRAVAALRASELGDDYAAAWAEWDRDGAEAWETTTADGLSARVEP